MLIFIANIFLQKRPTFKEILHDLNRMIAMYSNPSTSANSTQEVQMQIMTEFSNTSPLLGAQSGNILEYLFKFCVIIKSQTIYYQLKNWEKKV